MRPSPRFMARVGVSSAGLGVLFSVTVACSTAVNGNASDAGAPPPFVVPVDGGTSNKPMPDGYTQVPYRSIKPIRQFAKSEQVLDGSKDYIAILDLDVGKIVIDLYEAETPITVNSFVFLSLHHFYEQVAFHRVIDGFMAQTGDPNSVSGASATWGTGNPGYFFGTEFKPTLNFDSPGTLGMARTNDPNSNGSQFFITFVAYPSLNQQYTVWGKVAEGVDVLGKVAKGEPPSKPSRILEVRIGVKAK